MYFKYSKAWKILMWSLEGKSQLSPHEQLMWCLPIDFIDLTRSVLTDRSIVWPYWPGVNGVKTTRGVMKNVSKLKQTSLTFKKPHHKIEGPGSSGTVTMLLLVWNGISGNCSPTTARSTSSYPPFSLARGPTLSTKSLRNVLMPRMFWVPESDGMKP